MATISRIAFYISTIMVVGILASCFASKAMWAWFLLIILCGLVLITGQKLALRWTGSFGLIFFIIAAVRCVFLKISSEWLLLSVVAAVSLWNLDAFIGRLNQADKVEKAHVLERRHLKRLMITSGLGLLMGGIALRVHIKLSFGWMLFLAVALILGLSRFIDHLGRESD